MKGFPRICSLSDSVIAAEVGSESQTSLKCWVQWDVEEATGHAALVINFSASAVKLSFCSAELPNVL